MRERWETFKRRWQVFRFGEWRNAEVFTYIHGDGSVHKFGPRPMRMFLACFGIGT